MPLPWPPCARQGCAWPGLIKVEFEDEHGPTTAFVCPFCLREVRALLVSISAVREERRLLIEEEAAPVPKE